MKKIVSFFLAIIFALAAFFTVSGQSAETVWLTAITTSYKTGETVAVTVNTVSATPVQGLTFQIRYDPACLQPVSENSPIPGMNSTPLPQTVGLINAAFASAMPQTVNGILAEVRFLTLGECQTNLTLESATLAIQDQNGYAAPLAGVTLGETNIALNINKDVDSSELPKPVVSGTPLALDSTLPASGEFPSWLVILFSLLAGVTGVLIAVNLLRKP